jgi:hypothetical protein
MEEQAQKLIDATTKAFTSQRMMTPNVIPPPIAPTGIMVFICLIFNFICFFLKPRPFIMPGLLRPPVMPPNSAGFFMPPVPSGGFSIPTGMPRMPIPNMPIQPMTATSTENGAQLRT